MKKKPSGIGKLAAALPFASQGHRFDASSALANGGTRSLAHR
jgi:hypothetical protein